MQSFLEDESPTLRSSRPEVFCKKGVLRNFTEFTGKHLCQSLFFNKVAGLKSANFAKFLRTPFLTEHLRWLLLMFSKINSNFVKTQKRSLKSATYANNTNEEKSPKDTKIVES